MAGNKYRAIIIILLVVIIAASSIIAWSRYSGRQSKEIFIPANQEFANNIYVCGAANNPGLYPLKIGDNLQAIIEAAGNH